MAIWLTAQFLDRDVEAVNAIGTARPPHAETARLFSI
jgi:hypothetical protein